MTDWEDRYTEHEQIWSGEPNPVLVDVSDGLQPGRALDLGCGEGGDAVWLAENGWQVTGVDISSTALAHAAALADERGVGSRVTWLAANLEEFEPTGDHDLVFSFYLHTPVDFPRAEVLRRAAATLIDGGHLLVVGHEGLPPWAEPHHGHEHRFPTAEQEIAALNLQPEEWRTVLAEARPRELKGPEGQRAVIDDVVVLLRRSGGL
ncbi:MAG TPA: class I SAM-dependent methyltransferase [Actinomycetales bacterium]|jgi:SAM-dependent methyltransferase|nr:class I SAM-dependent methyltransferase [Actinomycetales bacterium]